MQEEACLGGGDVMRSSSPLEFCAERSGREHCPAGHELPIDVLVSVWQYCPQETIFACRLVCRLWNDLFLQELLRADSAQHFGALDGVQSGSVRKAVERSSARLGSRYCDVIPEDEDEGFAWMGKRLGRCEQSSGWQPQVANFSWTEWMELCRRHNAVCTKETGMLATTSSRSGSSVAKLEGVVARMRKMAAMQLTVNSAEEWLGHLADFRRAQHNIRCCRSRVSLFPSSPSRYCQVLLLPDGGLMRLDLGVEVFYRRPPFQWGCPSAEPVKGIPSRRKVAHCTSWAPELRYPAPEGESIFYNPYVGMPFLMGGRGLEPLPLECSTSKRAMDLRLGVKDSPCLDSTAWHDLQAFLRHSRSCTMPMITTDLFASFDFAPQVMPTTSMHNFTFAQVDVTPLPNIGWSSSRVSRLMSRLYPTEASTADVPIHIVRRNTDITESVMRRHPSAILNAVDLFSMVLMGLTASLKFEPVFAGDESHPEQEASGEEASVDASASSRVVAALSNVPHDSTVLEDGGDESPSARGVILGNLLEDTNLIASCGTDGCVLLCAISRVGYRRLGQLEGVGATEVAILGAPVFQRVEGTTPIAKVEVPRHIATRLGPCHAPNYLEDEQLSGVEKAEVLLLALSMQSMAYICTHTVRRELCYMASVSSDTTMILHGYLYYAESITITLRQEIGLCSVVAIPRPLTCVRGGLNGCATWSSSPSWRPQEDGHPFFCWPFLAVGRRRTGVKVFYRRSADQQHGPRRDDEHESLFDGVRILPPTSVHGSEVEDEPIECVNGRPSPRQLRVLLKDVTAITISPSHAMLLVANDSHQVFVVAPSLAAAKEEEEEVLPKDSLPAPTFRPGVGARQGKRMGLFSSQDEHGVTWIHRHFSPGRENESSSSSSSSSYSVYVGEGVFAGAAPTDAQTPSMRLYHPEVTSPPHHDSDAGDELPDGATPRAVVGPIEVFGRGFLLDPCLHALQSTYPSLIPPPTDSQQQPRPLVFVAFVVQEKRGKLAGIRDMAVDDWKLTVITAYLDVVIYDVAALMKEGEVGGKAPTPGLQELSPLMHFPRATPLMSLGVLSAPLFSPALQTSSWLLRLASVSGLDSWKNRSRLRNCFSWQGGIFALHHVPAFMCTVVVDFEALCPSSSESDQDDESGAGGMEATPPNEEAAFASPFPETGLPLGSPFGARPRTPTSLGSRGSPRTSPRNSPRMRSLPGVRVDHSLLNVPHVPFGTHLGLRVVMQMLSPFAVASGVGALIYTAMQLDRQQGPLSAGLALWILPSLVPIEGSLVTRQQHVYQDRWIGWWLCVLRGFLLMVVVPILFVVKYDLQLYRDTTLPLRWMHVGLFCSAGIVMEALCQWMDIKVVERRLVSYRWSFTVWVILPTLALSAASPPLIGQYFDAPRHHHGTTPQFPLAVACAPIMASIVISCLSLAISSTISSNLPSLWYVVPAVIHLIIMGFLLLPCILFITNFSSYWKWRNGESREESQPQLMVAMVFVCIIASIWGIGVLWEPTRRLVRILW